MDNFNNNQYPQDPQQPVAPQQPVDPQQPVAPQQPTYVQPQQVYVQQPVGPLAPPPAAKGKAIASMVLGIVAAVFCWFGWFSIIALALSVVAIILGVQARNACPVGYQGRGMATAGLVLGIVGAALAGIAVVCWICVVASFSSAVNELSAYNW